MNFAYLPPLILLQFKFKKASGQRDGRVVIGARRRPSPLADADRFSPSVGIHQMMRGRLSDGDAIGQDLLEIDTLLAGSIG